MLKVPQTAPMRMPQIRIISVLQRMDTDRVNGASYDTPQGIPSMLIKPVPQVVKPFSSEESGDPIVEVWIKLMHHTLVFDNREQSYAEGEGAYAQQREGIDDLCSGRSVQLLGPGALEIRRTQRHGYVAVADCCGIFLQTRLLLSQSAV